MLYLCFRFFNINCWFLGSMYDVYVMLNFSILEIMVNLLEGGWLLGDFGYFLKDFFMILFNILFI